MAKAGGFLREKMHAHNESSVLERLAQRELDQIVSRRILERVGGKLEDISFRDFCTLLEIRLKEGSTKPFGPTEWHPEQRKFDDTRSGRDVVIKPRQIGFSTLELARDLWYAVTKRGVNVLIIGHDGELVEQLFLTLKMFCDCLEKYGLLPKLRYSNKREIVFKHSYSAVRVIEAGGSEKSASKSGRSGTVHRLHATEVAFWNAAAETMGAVIQSVPKNGDIVIESTANGAGGLFYEDVLAARDGRSGFKLHFYAWFDHVHYRLPVPADFDAAPRDKWEQKLRDAGCDDEQITWWRSKVDDPKVGLEKSLQEYPVDVETCFRAKGTTWFAADVIDRLAERVRTPRRQMPVTWQRRTFAPALIYEEPQPGLSYVIFGDVSEGVSRDGSAGTVLERRTGRTVATWWSDTTEPGDFGIVLCALGWIYNGALVGWERNNHGHTTTRVLTTEVKYPFLYLDEDGRPGWNTTPASRPVLWDELADAIRQGAAWTPDSSTHAECKTIIRDEDGKPRARGKRTSAKDSCRDDRYVSWAGAWQLRSQPLQRVIRTIPTGL